MELNSRKCETCVRKDMLIDRMAVFLCFACEVFVCEYCKSTHRLHEGINVTKEERNKQKEKSQSKKSEGKTGLWGRIKESVRSRPKKKNGEKKMSGEKGGIEEKSESGKMEGKLRGLGKTSKRTRHEYESDGQDMVEEVGVREEKTKLRTIARKLWNDVMNESEIETTVNFRHNNVSICDRVKVKTELDQGNIWISGLCGMEIGTYIVCDCHNSCIKLFKLGSNELQRYIRFVGSLSEPWNVTEIHLKQNPTELKLEYGSSSDIILADRDEPHVKCLTAVTLPWKRQILVIDLSKKPALTKKIIDTKESCYSIQFYDYKIFTVCRVAPRSPWSVYLISTDGVTLNKFNIGLYGYVSVPYLAVFSGRVYLTDYSKRKVQCRNIEGKCISEIRIEGSGPRGITVDPNNNIYVSAQSPNKIYKIDADLTRYESVLEQTTDNIDGPCDLCYYKDKLLMSHYIYGSVSSRNIITVVRLR